MEITFKCANEPWTQEEDDQLTKLYNIDALDIIQISKIQNRSPGQIISRLIKYDFIKIRMHARGYTSYKNSELYKNIVSTSIKNKMDKQQDKLNKRQEKIDGEQDRINKRTSTTSKNTELQNDVKEMKKEISELKTIIHELVEMMKAVYVFEDA